MEKDYKKLYEDALKNLKRIKEANRNNNELVDFIEYKYPELKESEDERIRKALIKLVRMVDKNPIGQIFGYGDIKYSDMIAWLKKQGEPKPEEVDNLHNYLYSEHNHAWSEEDEKLYKSALWHIKNSCGNRGKNSGEFEVYNWLKSLKDRVQQPKQELSVDAATNEYIDLGLPSGTLWKSSNEDGYYTYDDAVEKFGNQLPTKEQWKELRDKCKWEWKGVGYEVTSPNGNTIFLDAAGYRYGTCVYDVDAYGNYWSSYSDENYAWYMYFSSGNVFVSNYYRGYGLSVRLVK